MAPPTQGSRQAWPFRQDALGTLEDNPVRHTHHPQSHSKLPILQHGESKWLSMSFKLLEFLATPFLQYSQPLPSQLAFQLKQITLPPCCFSAALSPPYLTYSCHQVSLFFQKTTPAPHLTRHSGLPAYYRHYHTLDQWLQSSPCFLHFFCTSSSTAQPCWAISLTIPSPLSQWPQIQALPLFPWTVLSVFPASTFYLLETTQTIWQISNL